MRESPIQVEGTVLEVVRDGLFRVELPNGKVTSAHLSRHLKTGGVSLQTGSKVGLEMTPFDFDSARIAEISAAEDGAP